jgi:hypothetical protein
MKFKILTGLVTGLVVSATTSIFFCQPSRAGNARFFSHVAQIDNSDLAAGEKAEDFFIRGEEKYRKETLRVL